MIKNQRFTLDYLFKRKLEISNYIFVVFLSLTFLVSAISIVGNLITNYPLIANVKWIFAMILSGIGYLLIYKNLFVETFKAIVFLAIHFFVVWPSWFIGGGDNSITMLYMFLLAIESLLVFEKACVKWIMVVINMVSLVACTTITYQFPHFIDRTHVAQNVFADTLLQICIIFVVVAVSVNAYIKNYRKQHLLLEEAFSNLETAATVDEVSQVYNRRKILEQYEQVRSLNPQKEIFVLMIDIDYFKNINDRYGHQIGDKAILHFASHLSSTIKSKTIGRYGGDEFIAFISDAKKEMLPDILEGILEVPPFHEITFTASAGLAQALPGQSITEVIHAADELLLKAKTEGRNQIQMYDGTVIKPTT